MEYKYTDRLLDFIQASPSCFHVVENFAGSLSALGYTELSESQSWELRHGGKYFVRRNGSSIIAFRIPKGTPSGFMMAAAHSDSPTFKVKENPEKPSDAYVQLSTEKYGGMLMATWFDRPLSVAGRIIVSEGDKLKTKLVNVDRDLLVIPSVAIHMNRSANDGMKYSAAVDTLPLYGTAEGAGSFLRFVAESVGVEKESIVGTDLFLYCRGRGTQLGSDGELILSPKLDDLQCAFGCMEGFTDSQESAAIPVCCVFDNEEVGSATKQGAASSLLRDTLRRICLSLGYGEERYRMLLAQSFLVSADNAHAKHPNHPEYSDALNCPVIGGGVVVKRLDADYPKQEAVERVLAHLGQPYDWYYLPGNGRTYCSELVEESYLYADSTRIFPAKPMRFRAADGTMPQFWTDLFHRLGASVPEGEPGTNPNDMSRFRLLHTVRVFR